MMQIKTVAVYVLNYNGEQLLTECIPSLCEAVKRTKYKTTLRVIDNASTDRSFEIMRTHFSGIHVIRSENNYFSSFNRAIEKYDDDVVILLNNDVKVDINFIDPLASVFEQYEDAFMASPHCMDFNNKRYEGGRSLLVKKFGWWGTVSKEPIENNSPIYTASMGACMAFRRDRFQYLGGFDPIYNPGIIEDLDLCYRGWKNGWKAYNILESKTFHKGQATFKITFGSDRVSVLATRNTFFFIWKNISDTMLLTEHLLCIPVRLLLSLITGRIGFIQGFIQACGYLPQAMKRRNETNHKAAVSDRKLLELLKG